MRLSARTIPSRRARTGASGSGILTDISTLPTDNLIAAKRSRAHGETPPCGLVPRTRRSHSIAGSTVANFGFKAALESQLLASVLRFRSSHWSVVQGWANFGTG